MTTVLDSINQNLRKALSDDARIILMGEDILDPYGGAFKVTRGLSTQFPERVITTPISEAGVVGVATGLALRGYKPLVEIMFGDFSTLVVDQVINHLAKFGEMFGKDIPLPVVIRTPMGGRRGYGPTHSQSLERLFLGVNGLRVVAPSHLAGYCGELLYDLALNRAAPTLFIENKLQYLLEILDLQAIGDLEINSDQKSLYSPLWFKVKDAPIPELTVVTYGYMLDLAIKSMLELAYSEELFIEICAFTQLSPLALPIQLIDTHLPVLIVEEGALDWGWGAEVAAQLAAVNHRETIRRLGARSTLIPAAPNLEAKVLPQIEDILTTVKSMRGKA